MRLTPQHGRDGKLLAAAGLSRTHCLRNDGQADAAMCEDMVRKASTQVYTQAKKQQSIAKQHNKEPCPGQQSASESREGGLLPHNWTAGAVQAPSCASGLAAGACHIHMTVPVNQARMPLCSKPATRTSSAKAR